MNKLKGKTILLINGMSVNKMFILKRIKKLGVKIICLDRNIKDFAKPFVDKWLVSDLNNYSASLAVVEEFIKKGNKIDGVITFWEECVMLVSKIAEKYHFPGIPFSASRIIKNKYLFRMACLKKDIPAPASYLLRNKRDLNYVKKNFNFPIIVKPIYGASSAFVIKIDKSNKLDEGYNYVKKNVHSFWLAPEWESLEIVAEEYIDGKEVDIDVLVQNGEIRYYTINDNKRTKEPFFVELGQWSPSILSKKAQSALYDMAKDSLKKLKVTNGCVHFEAKYGSHGAVPIEINLRMGGGHVYLFSKNVWGVDLVENAVKICLGFLVKIKKPVKPRMYLVGGQLLPNKTGLITEININKNLKKQPYFVSMYFEKKVGDMFLCPPNGYDGSVGRLLVWSKKSVGDAKKLLLKGSKLIRFKLQSRVS